MFGAAIIPIQVWSKANFGKNFNAIFATRAQVSALHHKTSYRLQGSYRGQYGSPQAFKAINRPPFCEFLSCNVRRFAAPTVQLGNEAGNRNGVPNA